MEYEDVELLATEVRSACPLVHNLTICGFDDSDSPRELVCSFAWHEYDGDDATFLDDITTATKLLRAAGLLVDKPTGVSQFQATFVRGRVPSADQ